MKFAAQKRLYPFYILAVLAFPFLFIGKGNVLLFLNQLHTPSGDSFFASITNLGDGVFIPIFLLILLFFYKFKYTYQFAISALFQIIVVLLMKEVFFSDFFRPYFYFKEIRETLHFVPGVKIRYTDTFPSGHTATVFFITTYFSLVAKKKHKMLPIVLCLLAACVGLSRIYLLQHFFIDVYCGMFFGILSSVTARYIVKKYPKSWYNKRIIVNWPPKISIPVKRLLSNFNLW